MWYEYLSASYPVRFILEPLTGKAERWRSPAAGSGADAVGSQVQRFVRPELRRRPWTSPPPGPDCFPLSGTIMPLLLKERALDTRESPH